MQVRPLIDLFLIVITSFAAPRPAIGEDNAAIGYFFAALELQAALPDHVQLATTDNPEHGFSECLTEEHLVFLRRKEIVSALAHFDHATSASNCHWGRYETSNWSDAGLNDRLHRMARVALLRARLQYESGSWKDGNRDVERVRVLARHLALQARPFEHQLFMIENMATGTAAAYLLKMPWSALTDLVERDRRVGLFMPMSQMMAGEASRIRKLADETEAGAVALEYLLECLSPYIESVPGRPPFGNNLMKALGEARDLATLLEELSRLVGNRDIVSTERRIQELCARHAQDNRLPAAAFDWASHELRENAQAICRSLIFRSLAERLQSEPDDLTGLEDPYGDGELEVQDLGASIVLYSDLVYHSRIDFRLGSAADGDGAANKSMHRSGGSAAAEFRDMPPAAR